MTAAESWKAVHGGDGLPKGDLGPGSASPSRHYNSYRLLPWSRRRRALFSAPKRWRAKHMGEGQRRINRTAERPFLLRTSRVDPAGEPAHNLTGGSWSRDDLSGKKLPGDGAGRGRSTRTITPLIDPRGRSRAHRMVFPRRGEGGIGASGPCNRGRGPWQFVAPCRWASSTTWPWHRGTRPNNVYGGLAGQRLMAGGPSAVWEVWRQSLATMGLLFWWAGGDAFEDAPRSAARWPGYSEIGQGGEDHNRWKTSHPRVIGKPSGGHPAPGSRPQGSSASN